MTDDIPLGGADRFAELIHGQDIESERQQLLKVIKWCSPSPCCGRVTSGAGRSWKR
jgi:hypothetical protein